MTQGQLVDIDPGLVLRAARYELPPADRLIYAVAMRYDATLWMQDNDFEALLNVRYFAK
jgi:predicted nucleic acid-binding protein